jgi:hypothetical protein
LRHVQPICLIVFGTILIMYFIKPENQVDFMFVDVVSVLFNQFSESNFVDNSIFVGELRKKRLEISSFLVVDQKGMFKLT